MNSDPQLALSLFLPPRSLYDELRSPQSSSFNLYDEIKRCLAPAMRSSPQSLLRAPVPAIRHDLLPHELQCAATRHDLLLHEIQSSATSSSPPIHRIFYELLLLEIHSPATRTTSSSPNYSAPPPADESLLHEIQTPP
ncbi:uncharacterized protein A4U43_C04F20910 [Asparagus officinalis]|uniref:Uncharacterized protein n=1 Tax=Asparagus officinalis TaxID=4686 RepID=A0A5P1F350_ASPOF|nr:uncharacterized protein A4U43_C04F20910 [Asparagus officinalis]